MIKLKDILKELEVTPNKKWVDYNLSSIDTEGMEDIWKMYVDSYEKEGLDLSAIDAKELASKYKGIQLIDIDNDAEPDAFIIYKPTKVGNKMALMGTNGKKDAKRAVVKKLIELVNTQGWFIEASKKMEDIMKSVNAPVIDDEEVVRAVVGAHKEPKMIGDGYYERYLKKVNKKIIKRIYGKPNV